MKRQNVLAPKNNPLISLFCISWTSRN